MTISATRSAAAHSRKMLLGAQVMTYGSADAAWRWPAGTPNLYFNLDAMADVARTAERGKFQFLFIADHAAVREDLTNKSPSATIDPVVVASHLIGNTSRIGVVITQSTTFNFPYTVARQLKALDLLSAGRMGWNAVTTNDPLIAANFGAQVADRDTRYARAHEFIQLVHALWDSWGEEALKLDVDAGIFADASLVQPINAGGQFVASRGPLPIPPSPQGQPIVFQAGGGAHALQLAGMYASGVYSMATDAASGREHRAMLDRAARMAGRDPRDVKLFMGVMTSIGETREAALARREALMRLSPVPLAAKLRHLSALVGIELAMDRIADPIPASDRAQMRPAMHQLHGERAAQMLDEGKSPFEVLLHGITEFHRVLLGSPNEVADQLETLFEAGAADGFVIVPDVVGDGLQAFVNGVIPILQARGLYHSRYEGETLRHHFGVAKP